MTLKFKNAPVETPASLRRRRLYWSRSGCSMRNSSEKDSARLFLLA
jgi:hypothetical protein